MFVVINKEKIYAYVASVFMIVILFFMSQMLNSDVSNSKEVYSNLISNNAVSTNEILNENVEEHILKGNIVPN